MADRGYAGGMEEFPEEVGWVRVSEAGRASHQAWVYAYEEEDQVGWDGVAEEGGRGRR